MQEKLMMKAQLYLEQAEFNGYYFGIPGTARQLNKYNVLL